MVRSTFLIIVLFLIGLLTFSALGSGFFTPVRGARCTLAFLPPVPTAPTNHPEDFSAEQTQLKAWAHPLDWASDYLMSEQAPADLDQSLHAASSSVRGRACTLLEERRLHLRELSPYLLEIEVREADPQVALSLCQGLVTSLKAKIQKDIERLEMTPRVNTPCVLTLEKLEAREARLARSGAQPESTIAQQFALQHFQEEWGAWRQAKQERDNWRRQIQDCAPHFSVISGPELTLHKPVLDKMLLSTLFFSGLVGVGLSRRKSKP